MEGVAEVAFEFSLWIHPLDISLFSINEYISFRFAAVKSSFQGIFPTQGLNPGLPHCKQTLYHLSQGEATQWI